MTNKFSALMFDMDGTLVDSAPDILACLDGAFFKVTGRRGAGVDRAYIGFQVRDIAARVLPDPSPELVEAFNAEFRALYDGSSYPGTTLFPGVAETLAALSAAGTELFMVTNKPVKPARAILKKTGLAGFAAIVAPDIIAGRGMTKTEMIAHLMAERGLPAEKCLYVGDAEPDVEAAKNNAVRVAVALYGYGNREKLRELAPEYFFEDISALLAITRG